MVGGLGNQLYQFSYAYYVFKQLGFKKLVIHISDMNNYNENWGLLINKILNIEGNKEIIISSKKINITKLRLPKILCKFITKLPNRISLIGDKNADKYYKLSESNIIIIDGYFEKTYIKNSGLKYIKSLIKDGIYDEKYKRFNVVNIRGGEYARLGLSKDSDIEFYIDSIKKIKPTAENNKWIVVTDDKYYAEKILKGIDIKYEIAEPDPIKNFSIVLSSSYKILSRSTFSKWAGALSQEECTCFFLDPF